MYIADINTTKEDALNIDHNTKRFGVVISSLCSQSLLDSLEQFYQDLNLGFAEKSSAFSYLSAHHLQVHTTEDSRECVFNNLLPYVYESEAQAHAALKSLKANSGYGATKIFYECAIVDVEKVEHHLAVHPFHFCSANSLVFDKPNIQLARDNEEKLGLFFEMVDRLLSHQLDLTGALDGKPISSSLSLIFTIKKGGGSASYRLKASELLNEKQIDALALKIATTLVKDIAPYVLLKQHD